MANDEMPVYALSIREFKGLVKLLVNEVLKERAIFEHDKQGNNASNNEDTLSTKELCAYLKCTTMSIHNYKKLGLPFYKLGRKLLFKKAEVLEFMATLKSKRVIHAYR
jgi:excisionase family DNA binding protein